MDKTRSDDAPWPGHAPGQERRGATRRNLRIPSLIFDPAQDIRLPCTLVNLSATGAGLQIDRKSALPERFVLLIAGAEALKRACICVRRNGRNVGVRFNDAQFAWKKQDTSDSRQFASNNL